MKIAIVDDDKEDRIELLDMLHCFLHNYSLHCEIEEFPSGEAFLKAFMPDQYDLCFLDICMKQINGMDTARLISKKDPDCFIIFLTSSSDYMIQGYEVRAWRYLLKPLNTDKIEAALTPCFEKILISKRYLNVRVDKADLQIPFSKISFVTVVGRKVELHFHEEYISLSSTTTFFEVTEPLLSDERFILCNKGTVVNLQQIMNIDDHMITMKNNTTLLISRRKFNEIKTAYLNYTIQHM